MADGGSLKWMYLFGGGFVGRFAEKWGDHRKKNFFIINSVGLSMCDSPIETVKYIWKDI